MHSMFRFPKHEYAVDDRFFSGKLDHVWTVWRRSSSILPPIATRGMKYNIIVISTVLTRICASLGLRMKLKTLFMSDEEKHSHHFYLPFLAFNMLKHFLAPRGLTADLAIASIEDKQAASPLVLLSVHRPCVNCR